jgi:nicotinamidase-related amidase
MLQTIGRDAVHVAVDLQRLFAEPAGWRVPELSTIVPNVADLTRAKPSRTVFTRFTVPARPEDAPGQWRRFYEHWSAFTGEKLDPELIGLLRELADLADPALVIDKPTYSAFEVPEFADTLRRLGADTLVFTGVETDVCVLATLLTAVDRGFRAIAVEDALASSSRQAHDATLRHILPRFDKQVEIATAAAVLAAWS